MATSETLLNIGTQCRLCGNWYADGDVKIYDVVLDDGEYPATPLCEECAVETEFDSVSFAPAPPSEREEG